MSNKIPKFHFDFSQTLAFSFHSNVHFNISMYFSKILGAAWSNESISVLRNNCHRNLYFFCLVVHREI